MKYYKLKDLCTDIVDCPHSTPDWKDAGIRVVRNFNLKEGNLDFSDGYFVNENTYMERTKRAVPEEGDIIISREAPMGIAAIVPKGLKCCLGQRLVLLKVDRSKCNPFYLLNTLMSDYVQIQFKRADFGSIVSNLCIPDLKEINIPVIVGKQNEVAHLLEIINRKLIINRQVNDNLQSQLRTMYDYWFKQFDFPSEDGKPYRASGGKLVWNQQLKQYIPRGWKETRLGEIFSISGEPLTSEDCIDSIYYSPIDVIPKRSITFAGGLPSSEANSSLQLYHENDVLLGAMRVYFHRVCIAAQTGVTRSTTMVLRPKSSEHLGYAYQVLNDDNAILFANQHSNGTQQPYINWNEALEDYRFAMPQNDELIVEYSNIAKPLIEQAKKNAHEIVQLTRLRDWLLPMLMNGQATVAD